MKKRKIVGPAVVGNIVEYYDFGLFAVYAHTIGSLFFPESDPFVQTLLAFATFAIGFFMRPLGGIVFGYIGDKFGRKTSLSTSVIGMAVCTFGIGILPDYASIGMAAPVILLIIRLIQGLCVGGEGAGVAIFVLEHMEGYRPGFMGSIVMASNMVGTLLAVFVGIFLNHFCGTSDCWRWAFIFGGIIGSVGLYLRYNLNETPEFLRKKDSKNILKNPLIHAIRKQWASILTVLCLGGSTTAVAYTIRGYLNVFFLEVANYTQDEALYFTSFALFVLIVFLPLFGMLSDKIGNKKTLYIVSIIICLFMKPTYDMLAAEDVRYVFMGLFALGAMAAGICAPAYSYAIKAFEVELRFSGVAFSWNLGLAVFGGTTPMISRYLSEKYSPTAPAYYLIVIAFMFVFVSFLTRKLHK